MAETAASRKEGRPGLSTRGAHHPKVAHLPNTGSHGRALNLKFWQQASCVLVLIRQLAGSGKFKVWSAGPGWSWLPSVPALQSPGSSQPKVGEVPTQQAAARMEACQLTLHLV